MNATVISSTLQSLQSSTTMIEWILLIGGVLGGGKVLHKLSRSDCRLKWGSMILDIHSKFRKSDEEGTSTPPSPTAGDQPPSPSPSV